MMRKLKIIYLLLPLFLCSCGWKDAKGASKLELQGTAEKANITIAGAGELEAEDLLTQVMHINCAGASKAEVNVATELWAQAAGASKITYKGTPRVKQNMAVGGSIIRRD